MEKELEKIKEYTQKISMSSEEKFEMFKNVRKYSIENNFKPSPFIFITRHSIAYLTILIFVVGTSATSMAAEWSLPGDILYPIKTEVNEEIIKTISIDEESKAKTNVKLIEKRMSEITELVIKEKNTEQNLEIVSNKLNEHLNDIEEIYTETESQENKREEVQKIQEAIESITENQIEVLNELSENSNEQEENKADINEEKQSIDENNATSTNIIENNDESNINSALSEVIDFSEKIDHTFEEIIK